MKTDYTDITLVIDRSGSMEQIRSDMEGAMSAFVREQAQLPGKCLLSVLQFDSEAIEWLILGKPIAEVTGVPLQPRGSTPLLDAMGKAMADTGQRLAAIPERERPGKVLFVVITDGLENASREWTLDGIKTAVEHQRGVYKWAFLFLGAHMNAVDEAAKVGIAHAASYASTKAGVEGAAKRLRYAASSFRASGDVKKGLDQADEEDAKEMSTSRRAPVGRRR